MGPGRWIASAAAATARRYARHRLPYKVVCAFSKEKAAERLGRYACFTGCVPATLDGLSRERHRHAMSCGPGWLHQAILSSSPLSPE